MSQNDELLFKVDLAIEKSIGYLEHRQMHNGEFLAYISGDETMQQWCAPDSTNYMTAIIAHCLLPLQQYPAVDKMLKKSTDFFQYQMMRGGTWNYLTKFHWLFRLNAPDVDDTALISDLLKKRNIPIPNNIALLKSNRNADGLFYTWFTFHGRLRSYPPTFWKIVARELKSPFSNLLLWKKSGINRNDIDSAINANVISYLGHSEITEQAIQFLVKLIKENSEAHSDHYYKNPFVFYYFVSRLVWFGIQPLVKIKNLIAHKLNNLVQTHKSPLCDLELAIAVSSLLMLHEPADKVTHQVWELLQRQSTSFHWKRHAFYSTSRGYYWGCEELTTALCIEALHLYKNAGGKRREDPGASS